MLLLPLSPLLLQLRFLPCLYYVARGFLPSAPSVSPALLSLPWMHCHTLVTQLPVLFSSCLSPGIPQCAWGRRWRTFPPLAVTTPDRFFARCLRFPAAYPSTLSSLSSFDVPVACPTRFLDLCKRVLATVYSARAVSDAFSNARDSSNLSSAPSNSLPLCEKYVVPSTA